MVGARPDDKADELSLAEQILRLADWAGIPASLISVPNGRDVRLRISRDPRRPGCQVVYEDWRNGEVVAAGNEIEEVVEQLFLSATQRLAWREVQEAPVAGESPRERAFRTQVEMMARVRPEWGERLANREAEVLRRPGHLKL
jgi:hypothetical protein